jgi:hypothetical protein
MKSGNEKLLENGQAVFLAGWLNHNTDEEARDRILFLMTALKERESMKAHVPQRHRAETYHSPLVTRLRNLEKIIQQCFARYDVRLVAVSIKGELDFLWMAAPGSEQEARETRHSASHHLTRMEEEVGPETQAARYVWESLKDGSLDKVMLCDNNCGRWIVRRSKKPEQFCGTRCYYVWYSSRPEAKEKRAATARKNYVSVRTQQQGKRFVPRRYTRKNPNPDIPA